jgi:hypothetical protein
METLIWSCQILLAAAFLYSGFCKTFFEKQKVISMGQTGVKDISASFMHWLGFLELLGVFGLVLPWSIQAVPVLTPITAICFAILMLLAARVHYRLNEPKNVRNNIILFALCVFVAYFRFHQLQ